MNAQNIIAFVNESNISLSYTEHNLIVKAPKGIISEDFKETLKNNKNELITLIKARQNKINAPAEEPYFCWLSEDEQEFFEERAAIMEYDTEIPRPQAEQLAVICLNNYRKKRLIN